MAINIINPFNYQEQVTIGVATTVYLLVGVSNAILMRLWWINRKNDQDSAAIMVIVTDFVSSFNLFAVAISTSKGGLMDGNDGVVRCVFTGVWGFCTSFTSLFAVIMYTYHRWRVLSQQSELDIRLAFFFIGLFFAICIAIALLPFYANGTMIVEPAGTYCMVDWTNNAPSNLFVLSFAFTVTFLFLAILTILYLRIYYQLESITNALSGPSHTLQKSNSQKNSAASMAPVIGGRVFVKESITKQKILIKRAIVIVAASLATYSPVVLGIFYESIRGEHVPTLYDAAAAHIMAANGFIDFIIFITSNSAYKKLFWESLGFKRSRK